MSVPSSSLRGGGQINLGSLRKYESNIHIHSNLEMRSRHCLHGLQQLQSKISFKDVLVFNKLNILINRLIEIMQTDSYK